LRFANRLVKPSLATLFKSREAERPPSVADWLLLRVTVAFWRKGDSDLPGRWRLSRTFQLSEPGSPAAAYAFHCRVRDLAEETDDLFADAPVADEPPMVEARDVVSLGAVKPDQR
jgi:hypothetical protein